MYSRMESLPAVASHEILFWLPSMTLALRPASSRRNSVDAIAGHAMSLVLVATGRVNT
jgi:hypothetical protein